MAFIILQGWENLPLEVLSHLVSGKWLALPPGVDIPNPFGIDLLAMRLVCKTWKQGYDEGITGTELG